MSDDEVLHYLRRRSQVQPPPDFIGAVIDAIGEVPQRRAAWFAPLLPAAAVLGAAAALAVAVVLLNQPPSIGPTPEPSTSPLASASALPASARPSASPTPAPASYVERAGLPFTVIDSAHADALFRNTDTCSSPDGYTVRFPDDWYTNTAVGTVPACSWFSPDFFEVVDSGQVPDEIAIELRIIETGLGQIPEYPRTLQEDVTISGVSGFRTEDTIPSDPPDYAYGYAAWLDDNYLGPKVIGSTSTLRGGDYALNRAVLDRMMASLFLTDPNTAPNTFVPQPNPAADALVSDQNTCINRNGGYAVDYPSAWYANEAGNPAAADPDAECTHFAPEPMTEGVLPAITGRRIEGVAGSFEAVVDRQLHTIAGRPAVRVEYRGAAGEGGTQAATWRELVWLVQLGEVEEFGPNVVFKTSTDDVRDFELSMAVLDRMMLSLRLSLPLLSPPLPS